MELVHRALAYVAVVAVVVGLIWSVLAAVRPTIDRRLLDRFGIAVVVLFLVASVAGGLQLATGARPKEDLHLVYAAIAIGLIPLARSFVVGNGRREAWLTAAAYLVLGGVLFRLFTTG